MRGTRAVLTGTVTLAAALALLPAATAVAAPATPATSVPLCSTADTRVTAEFGQSAGQGMIAVHVTATSACVTSGYPLASIIDAAGTRVATTQRTPRGYFGGLPGSTGIPPRVTLQAGQEATALVEFVTEGMTGGTCPSWSALRVTLPHNAGLTTVSLAYTACTQSWVIHPVLPGTTGRG